MPATQRGQTYRLKNGQHGIRYYDATGKRVKQSPFTSASKARKWYHEYVEPQLRGEAPPKPAVTVSEFVAVYLDRHATQVRSRTIRTLTERLRHAEARFGTIPLQEFARLPDEIAAWHAQQPEGVRYGRMAALRQTLEAAVRWGYVDRNPAKQTGKNRQPAPRAVRAYTMAELDAISLELSPQYQPLPMFAAATGLRPEEWMALERRDIARSERILSVRRTVSDGEVVELGKTSRSRRQVPLSFRALAALDALPPRLDTPLLWPAPEGGLLHVNNFRSREWAPAIEAAGVCRPARVYDLRATFASNALAAGISLFELGKIMGTSVTLLERTYGSLLDGAATGMADRLEAFERALERREGSG